MTHCQLLKYAWYGVNAHIEKEQKFVDEGKSQILSQTRLKKLWKDLDIISDMQYTEETGEVR